MSSLVYLLAWNHFILFFTQLLSSFRNTCPYHYNLFCCRIEIMSSNLNRSHNCLLGTLSFTLTSHILLSFSSLLAEVPPYFRFVQARSHAVQSPSHYQWYIHIDKQWYQLPKIIPSNLNSGLYSCISISIHTQHANVSTNWHDLCNLCWLLVTGSSLVSAITTKSSAYNNSHGKATLNCLDIASMRITNNNVLDLVKQIKIKYK